MTKQELLRAFKKASKATQQGHYLDRMIALTKALDWNDYTDLLNANKVFLNSNHKPAGLDALMAHLSFNIASWSADLGLTTKQVALIAWGVDCDALKQFGYLDARNSGSSKQKENI
jgi:hypothetical protein